jgi:hypothetical protein
MVRFDLGGLRTDVLPHGRIRHVLQQKACPFYTAQFAEGSVERALPAVGAELLEEHGRQDLARLNGQHHLHHVVPVSLNQLPIDHLGKQGVDVLVRGPTEGKLGCDPVGILA